MDTFDVGSRADVLQDVFALRFDVYCLERRYLPPSRYPRGLETDHFDRRSAHFAARNRSGAVAGTVRLVLSKGEPFPFESHCPAEDQFESPPREMCAEVSRLAVRKEYRRRKGDTFSGVNEESGILFTQPPYAGSENRANSPLLVLGLYRQAYRFSRANGIRYWYAAMERSLARVLARFDFSFTAIGPERDYYGPVTPYFADLDELERKLVQSNPELLDWFRYGS